MMNKSEVDKGAERFCDTYRRFLILSNLGQVWIEALQLRPQVDRPM